jgi:hypothetical protein
MTQGLCITNSPTIPSFSSTQNIASSKASDSTILQYIDQIVRNEILRQKGMTTGAQMAFLGEKKSNDSENSASNYQGKEYKRDCAKNTGTRNSANERNMETETSADVPDVPDMSKYVRKDSIPCWGCNIE